jgi:hypothetical protein
VKHCSGEAPTHCAFADVPDAHLCLYQVQVDSRYPHNACCCWALTRSVPIFLGGVALSHADNFCCSRLIVAATVASAASCQCGVSCQLAAGTFVQGTACSACFIRLCNLRCMLCRAGCQSMVLQSVCFQLFNVFVVLFKS